VLLNKVNGLVGRAVVSNDDLPIGAIFNYTRKIGLQVFFTVVIQNDDGV
jgi:hypothetical protein